MQFNYFLLHFSYKISRLSYSILPNLPYIQTMLILTIIISTNTIPIHIIPMITEPAFIIPRFLLFRVRNIRKCQVLYGRNHLIIQL